ncbi:MAG: tRNA (adenosine(37)-N6)-threonylcarbamoyltransferase complex ATPase subunit type 1 TsaE [Gammaproteobacteria bacterium]
MVTINGFLQDESATAALAQCLGALLPQQQTQLHLDGPLGAGKTSLVRSLLRTWGHKGPVKSPTYTLVETYNMPGFIVLHVDLYRLNDPEEMLALGLEETIMQAGVICIEWPCIGLPQKDIACSLDFSEDNLSRIFTLQAHSLWGEKVLHKLASTLPDSLQWP